MRIDAGAATAGSNRNKRPARPLAELAQSVVASPMLVQDRLVGVLYLDSSRPGRFLEADARLIEVIAGHLEARLVALRRRLAERSDILILERTGRGVVELTMRGRFEV